MISLSWLRTCTSLWGVAWCRPLTSGICGNAYQLIQAHLRQWPLWVGNSPGLGGLGAPNPLVISWDWNKLKHATSVSRMRFKNMLTVYPSQLFQVLWLTFSKNLSKEWSNQNEHGLQGCSLTMEKAHFKNNSLQKKWIKYFFNRFPTNGSTRFQVQPPTKWQPTYAK